MMTDDSVQSDYKSQLQTSPELRYWTGSRQQKTAFARIILRPEVIEVAAMITDMIMAGNPSQAASGSGAGSMQDFVSQQENEALVKDLIHAGNLNCTAQDFARFADGNDRLRNGEPGEALLRWAGRTRGALGRTWQP